jgi:hypothetical protein
MSVPITAFYAGILALIFMALAINVTRHRAKLRVSIGDGGNPEMLRMIRLHGNAAEYIPFAVLLMALYELNGGWHSALHIVGVALIVGRLVQSWGMWGTEVPGLGRRMGQGMTWLSILGLALLNLSKLA